MQTQDNQITKGTRVAVLYSYSDVIFVLKPKKKFNCDVVIIHGESKLVCIIPEGDECRYLGALCNIRGINTETPKTLYIVCF